MKDIQVFVSPETQIYGGQMSVLLPKFNQKQISLLKALAESFAQNKERIMENWEEAYQKHITEIVPKSSTHLILREIFELLLDDFITYITANDLVGYLNANSKLLRRASRGMDISFKDLMHGFHLFELSYDSFVNIDDSSGIDPMILIDKLHHFTIGEISDGFTDLNDTISFAIMGLVELRDPETNGHIYRTREYSKAIAREIGADDEFIHHMHMSSCFHDLGKLGIPDAVLLKQEPLNEQELGIMKNHTVIGKETIEKVMRRFNILKGYLNVAQEIAEFHHEKWDGSGYWGLVGEEIPLAARIFTLADVYDVLRSKRPYKSEMPHEKAVSTILNGDNVTLPTHFDPELLTCFQRLSDSFEKISRNHYVCDHWEISRSQIWEELSRGLGLKGTEGYRKMGCYECDNGLNLSCSSYSDVIGNEPDL